MMAVFSWFSPSFCSDQDDDEIGKRAELTEDT
jgi:hypothetical protein